jgi:predicted CopG family antitoxin
LANVLFLIVNTIFSPFNIHFMNKIIFPFKVSRNSELAKAAYRILSSLKANASFTDNVLIQLLEKCLNEFQVAMNNAEDGSRTMIAIRKEKRKALIEVMVQTGYYVMQVSNSDRVKLLSSGFDVTKETFERRSLATIERMQVSNTNPGEAYILVNRVKGARLCSSVFNRTPNGYNCLGERNNRSSQAHLYRVETVGYLLVQSNCHWAEWPVVNL